MSRRTLSIAGMPLLALLLTLATPTAPAQSVKPIPKLDLNQYMGTWYEIARYPIRRERSCVSDEMVLYSLGDKRNSFQFVTSCQIKQDYSNAWNSTGKLDKLGNGSLRLSWIWPFTRKYCVLAVDPGYHWALVGTPNHKFLWLLSRTTTIAPDLLTQIEGQATAQGFNTARLIVIKQH
jgi:apolipoprotein D and lipocalin family protein